MDYFRNAATKGYKFLQELDEGDSKREGGAGLEATLEGVSDRLLSWAGSAAAPKAQEPAEPVSGGRSPDAKEPAPAAATVEEAKQEPKRESPRREETPVAKSPMALEIHYIGDDDDAEEEPREAETPSTERGLPLLSAVEDSRELGVTSPSGRDRQLLAEKDAQLQEAAHRLSVTQRHVEDLERQLRDKAAASLQRMEQLEKQLRDRGTAIDRLEEEKERWREKAVAAERQESDIEKELEGHKERWLQKIAAAEQREKEAQQESLEKAAAVEKERDALRAELSKVQAELGGQVQSKEKMRQDVESSHAKARAECQVLTEQLHASKSVELQLRGEVGNLEKVRAELEQRCTDLVSQLERTQAAYDGAAAEVGSLSTRLHELEFGSNTDTSTEVMLRQQVDSMKEKYAELEQRFKECTWMRDYALQQAEEARAQLNAERTEQAKPTPGAKEAKDDTQEVEACRQEVEALKAQLQTVISRHQEEAQQQAQRNREEFAYLQRKSEEKDRRIELLTCERNALRYDSQNQASAPSRKPSQHSREGLDVEDGSPVNTLAGKGATAEAVGACLITTDAVLRRLTRLLTMSPLARRAFYSYIAFLHMWIWIVLHRAAAGDSPHGA